MDKDETTTVDQPQDAGEQDALPANENTDAADNTQQVSDDTTNQPTEGGNEPVPEGEKKVEDKLASFAKGQGIENVSELSEREQKLLKVAYDNNAEFQRTRQKATELEKSVTTQSDEYAEQVAEQTGKDPELLKRLARVEVKETVRDFFDSNPQAKEIEKDLIAELKQRPHLVNDLEALYAVTKSRNEGKIKSEGAQEALNKLAQNQQAAVPTGNATNSNQMTGSKITPQNVDAMVAKMTPEEYQKRLPEINRALVG